MERENSGRIEIDAFVFEERTRLLRIPLWCPKCPPVEKDSDNLYDSPSPGSETRVLLPPGSPYEACPILPVAVFLKMPAPVGGIVSSPIKVFPVKEVFFFQLEASKQVPANGNDRCPEGLFQLVLFKPLLSVVT